MAAEISAVASPNKKPSSSEASASSDTSPKKQLKIETRTTPSMIRDLLAYWGDQTYLIQNHLSVSFNQCFLLSKASNPSKLYLAKVTDLTKCSPNFTKANRGELLVSSIPPHPGIKTIANRYFFGNKRATPEQTTESQCAVFISDYDEGMDLFEFLTESSHPLSLDQALKFAIKIGNAVSYLHQQGIIYRDLKPENVLVKGDGSISLIDFEYAKYSSPNEPLSPVGSPSYTPPESYDKAFRNKVPKEADELGYQHDSFSFGALIFFLITGKPLFDDENSLVVIKRVCKYGKGTFSLDLTEIEDPLVLDVIRRLLDPNPKNRISVVGATEMLTKIQEERDPTPTI
jgi:serine/threonine protein kinase